MVSVPWLVGRRYFGAQGNDRFLSIIARVSLIGLVLGVVALTVVVSVMNGFDRELKYRILGVVPHLIIETTDPGALSSVLADHAAVAGFAPFLRRFGVAVQGRSNKLVSIYGIVPDQEKQVSILPNHLVSGSLADLSQGQNRVFMGRPLGFQLRTAVGDMLTLIIPEPSVSGNSVVPRLARVQVAGFFEVDSEVDYNLIVANLSDLTAMAGTTETTFRVTLADIFLAPAVKEDLLGVPGVTRIVTWTDEFGDFFETVRMEKIMMFILLSLIVAIAAFNIVSGLSMMVRDKQADIAVFRTMGLSPFSVMQTFVIQGAMVGLLGTFLGLAIGIPLAVSISEVVSFFESLFGARMLAGTYFDKVPSDLRIADLAAIAMVAIAISLVATLYPAYRASRLRPANVLRYE
ncbi:MAG: lipoprotein-releasing ABC transporter permease subunit [Pseudomonadales bacterium]